MLRPARALTPPTAISDHAQDNLVFIRQAIERSATFTAVPGVGGCVMGAIALVAAMAASLQIGFGIFIARNHGG